jgi:quinol-cytochrome oxidoreductase complex cytochrome b subunit
MPTRYAVRRGWLKFMYLYTIVGAGALGLGIVIVPQAVKTALRWPADEPISFGIVGSVYVAFGVLSVLGLRDPVKFAPVLLLQLCYKSVWFLALLLPLVIRGRYPDYGLVTAAVFASYIIGDLIAIPFPYLLSRASGSDQSAAS